MPRAVVRIASSPKELLLLRGPIVLIVVQRVTGPADVVEAVGVIARQNNFRLRLPASTLSW